MAPGTPSGKGIRIVKQLLIMEKSAKSHKEIAKKSQQYLAVFGNIDNCVLQQIMLLFMRKSMYTGIAPNT